MLLRPEIIPEIKLHLLAVLFAETALKAERKAGREPHPDSWKALKIKKQWLKNKATDEELAAAWSAAWSAVEKKQLKQVIKVLRIQKDKRTNKE